MKKAWRLLIPVPFFENVAYNPRGGFILFGRFFRQCFIDILFDSRKESMHFCHVASVPNLSDKRKRNVPFFFGSIVGQAMYSRLHMSDKIDIRFPAAELPLKAVVEAEAKRRQVSVGQVVREALAQIYTPQTPAPVSPEANFFKPQ